MINCFNINQKRNIDFLLLVTTAKEGSGGDKSVLKPWEVKLNQMFCSQAEHTTSPYPPSPPAMSYVERNKLIVFTVKVRRWFTLDEIHFVSSLC